MTEGKPLSYPPRVKLRLKPGRVAKWYPEVAWCEEEFTFDMVRDLPGEEIAYVPEALLEAAAIRARAEGYLAGMNKAGEIIDAKVAEWDARRSIPKAARAGGGE